MVTWKKNATIFYQAKMESQCFLIRTSLHIHTEKMEDFENVKITIYGAW